MMYLDEVKPGNFVSVEVANEEYEHTTGYRIVKETGTNVFMIQSIDNYQIPGLRTVSLLHSSGKLIAIIAALIRPLKIESP